MNLVNLLLSLNCKQEHKSNSRNVDNCSKPFPGCLCREFPITEVRLHTLSAFRLLLGYAFVPTHREAVRLLRVMAQYPMYLFCPVVPSPG